MRIDCNTGAEVDFDTSAGDKLKVYTTRPDTLYGATYMVISPEHPYIEKWASLLKNMDEIRAYQQEAAKKSDFERTEVAKEKTGVRLDGVTALNPLTGKEIPIFISDYVLVSYGTGAIMAVPAHDTRDWEFAKKFGLPIIEVVKGGNVEEAAFTDCETGIMVNSGILHALTVIGADAGNAPQPPFAAGVFKTHIITHQHQHDLLPEKGRIPVQIAPQISRQQLRLNMEDQP